MKKNFDYNSISQLLIVQPLWISTTCSAFDKYIQEEKKSGKEEDVEVLKGQADEKRNFDSH